MDEPEETQKSCLTESELDLLIGNYIAQFPGDDFSDHIMCPYQDYQSNEWKIDMIAAIAARLPGVLAWAALSFDFNYWYFFTVFGSENLKRTIDFYDNYFSCNAIIDDGWQCFPPNNTWQCHSFTKTLFYAITSLGYGAIIGKINAKLFVKIYRYFYDNFSETVWELASFVKQGHLDVALNAEGRSFDLEELNKTAQELISHKELLKNLNTEKRFILLTAATFFGHIDVIMALIGNEEGDSALQLQKFLERTQGDTCSICKGPWHLEDEKITNGSEIRELFIKPCGHIFHRPCIETWELNQGLRCPVCSKAGQSMSIARMDLQKNLHRESVDR